MATVILEIASGTKILEGAEAEKYLTESAELAICGGIITLAIGAWAIKLIKAYKGTKKDKVKKEIEDFIKNTSEMKAERKALNSIGEKLGKAVAEHLKKYATDNKFAEKYRCFEMTGIKYDPINGFDVQVSEFQLGINEAEVDKWEKANPGKDYSKYPEINNHYYWELLKEGVKSVNPILATMNKENKYRASADTADGDEAHVFIDLHFTKEYDDALRQKIETKYKDEIDKILNKK